MPGTGRRPNLGMWTVATAARMSAPSGEQALGRPGFPALRGRRYTLGGHIRPTLALPVALHLNALEYDHVDDVGCRVVTQGSLFGSG